MKRLVIFLVFLLSFSLASAISVDDFSLADLGFTGFVVEVNLDGSATAQVLYGRTGALGSATNLASSSSEHLLQVDGLAENTVYFYRVVGKDAQGNSYSSAISLTRTASNSGSSSSNNQPVDTTELKAFPSAEGFGKYATGGRGGRIIEVTNLNDAGTGSLRAALQATGKRTVIFKVAGYITLQSSIRVNADVTVAGESAPGDGITIRRVSSMDGALLNTAGNNIIMRGLRLRPGPGPFGECCGDALLLSNGNNMIFDHMSYSWSTDEIINPWGSNQITFQNSIFSEALLYARDGNPHGTGNRGPLVGAGSDKITFYNSYFAHNGQRNPLIGGDSGTGKDFELVNNVIYNWGQSGSAIDGDNQARANLINNVYIEGPTTFALRYGITIGEGATVYARGNYNRKRTSSSQDEWDAIGSSVNGNYKKDPAPKSWQATTPFNFPLKNQPTLSREQTIAIITNNAGAFKRDAIDTRVIGDMSDGDGKMISNPNEVGGYPSLQSGTPYVDSDTDGIADSWEFNVGGVVGRVDNNGDHDGDGYTNVEEYLHFLAGEGHS